MSRDAAGPIGRRQSRARPNQIRTRPLWRGPSGPRPCRYRTASTTRRRPAHRAGASPRGEEEVGTIAMASVAESTPAAAASTALEWRDAGPVFSSGDPILCDDALLSAAPGVRASRQEPCARRGRRAGRARYSETGGGPTILPFVISAAIGRTAIGWAARVGHELGTSSHIDDRRYVDRYIDRRQYDEHEADRRDHRGVLPAGPWRFARRGSGADRRGAPVLADRAPATRLHPAGRPGLEGCAI